MLLKRAALSLALIVAATGCGKTAVRVTPAMELVYHDMLREVAPLAEQYKRESLAGLGAVLDEANAADVPTGAVTATRLLPRAVDLRPKCPPIYHQGPFSTCTAFAVAKGLGEFMLRRRGDRTPLSATHFFAASHQARGAVQYNRGGDVGGGGTDDPPRDEGLMIAAAMATLELGGAVAEKDARPYPPEAEWRTYVQRRAGVPAYELVFYDDPIMGRHFPSVRPWLRWDGVTEYPKTASRLRIREAARVEGLSALKRRLAEGWPVVCGLEVHESFYSQAVRQSGRIPLPAPNEHYLGGHAMLIVGYDDQTRQLLLRNSWGTGWGEGGYGRIAYEAVERRVIRNCWTVGQE